MILPYRQIWPKLDPTVWVAPSAEVIGNVAIGPESSVWFQTVIRGDVHWIRIGQRTNIQDLSVCHVTRDTHPLAIGDEVTVGHRVILHGCTIGNRVLIGMGAIIMDGAQIGDDSIIGAGSLVTEGTRIEPGTLAMGSPAKPKRSLTEDERAWLRRSASNYVSYRLDYLPSEAPVHP